MTDDYEAYKSKMKQNEGIILQACEKTINKTILDMYKKIVDRTPVGDPSLWKSKPPADYVPGHLKASWSISFNNMQRNETGQFASSEQLIEGHGISLKVSNSETGKTAAISNNAVYAERIEYGSWSTQAPAGMMRITVAEYSDILGSNAAKYRIK